MGRYRNESELQRFFKLWSPRVLSFCRLYTGDLDTSEIAVEQAFLKYFRSELPLQLDRLPVTLMSFAVEACPSGGDGGGTDSVFESAVRDLPPDERAVFILHCALGLQLPWVAAITRLPFEAVGRLRIRALLRLRGSFVNDAGSRGLGDPGTVPPAPAGSRA